MIPKSFIVDLVDRADVAEVVGRRVQLKKAGKEFKACCPFHDEKTPSFTVVPTKGFYHCFGCGANGNALDFLMNYDHMDFVEAVESLANMMGIEVPREEGTRRPAKRHDALYELMSRVARFYRGRLAESTDATRYLADRGIDDGTADRFGIGFAPDGWRHVLDKFGASRQEVDRLLAAGLIIRRDDGKHYDRFRNRLMFPIRDARGRVIGFGGRVIGDDSPKYLNSPETGLFHKGRELYGFYEARQALRHIDRLVVVEGYMDVVALARNGINFAVATMGTATTTDHLSRLFRHCDEVVFCFDGDRGGRGAAWKALEMSLPAVRDGRQIRFIFLPEGEDPDSLVRKSGSDAFMAALDDSLPLSDFLIEELASQVDMNSVDGRARMAELAKPLLASVPPGIYRELLIENLSQRVGLGVAKLEALLGKPERNQNDGRRRQSTKLAPPGNARDPGQPSVVRRAITLIVQHPDAAMKADVERLADVGKPGIGLLRDLIETVQGEPNITTAGLIERFRNDSEGQYLGTLAATELPSGEGFDAAAELADCLRQLDELARRERIQFLIEKQRVESLEPDELEELRGLTSGPEKHG